MKNLRVSWQEFTEQEGFFDRAVAKEKGKLLSNAIV